MDIVFSANNREEVITFPYAPEGIELSSSQSTEEFNGLSQNLLLIGNMELRSFSLSGYWFKNSPSWISSAGKEHTPEDYVTFFNKWREKLVPIRCVITKADGNEFINLPVVVKTFTYSYNKSGDIEYSLDLTEYAFIK